MLSSLRSPLALSNLLITLIGLLVLVVVFTQLLAQHSIDEKRHELAAQSQAVAQQVELIYKSHGGRDALKARIDLASRLLGERIIVASPQGKIVLDSAYVTPFFKGSTPTIDRGALLRAQPVSSLKKRNLVLFQRPLQGTHGHRNGGAVVLVARAADVRPNPELLVPIVLAAIGTALVVWLLLGGYFTFSVFRPLTRITEATRRMARGDYGVRVGARGQGEIAQLATSFNHMAQQVQSSNQVLRDFLANVSHDLRTPLTIITGFSQAMLDGTASGEAAEDSAEVIHEEALKMQHLVDDLMQLTRLESGLLRLEHHPIELQPLVQRLIERTEMATKGMSIPQLRNAVPVDLPPVDGDPDQVERALRNLIGNAVQYTPSNGTVTVQAEAGTPGWIEVSVIDTGPGIPAEELPRIFERFYRSDKSREREHGHSGLGLAIVREIVEAHGGRVTVESVVGQGTQFRLTLPKASRLSAQREAAEAPQRARQAV